MPNAPIPLACALLLVVCTPDPIPGGGNVGMSLLAGTHILSPQTSPDATPGGYTVLRTRLPDGLPRAAIYSAIFCLPVTRGGQVLERMNLFFEVLLGMSTLRMCMGKGTGRSLRVSVL